ncbi:MAG TPA: DUF899 family protein [Candidatus Eisenbacteria bacterium]|nr:DUF899 family protein [Candidatus Eisenbacteria bacterium]
MNPEAPGLLKEIERLEEELLQGAQRLAELKRGLPRLPVKDYVLAGPSGPVSLSSLFGAKDDLIVIHNMGKGCRYCTLWADGFNGVWPHLADRAGFVVCSPDSVETQKTFAESRGWTFPMVSGHGSSFIEDMGFRSEKSWRPGVSTFHRSGDGAIERVASAEFGPYDPFCGVWHLIALLDEGEKGWEPKYAYPG